MEVSTKSREFLSSCSEKHWHEFLRPYCKFFGKEKLLEIIDTPKSGQTGDDEYSWVSDMSGLELQARLVQTGCQIPVIFITGYADVRMAVDAMKTGAVNFLEKPFRPQELFDEIQHSLRSAIEKWQQRDEEQSIECKLALLKSGEREVLGLIKEGKTNEQIARRLQISVRGVEARRAKAMRTLRVDSKTELVKLLRVCTPHKSPK